MHFLWWETALCTWLAGDLAVVSRLERNIHLQRSPGALGVAELSHTTLSSKWSSTPGSPAGPRPEGAGGMDGSHFP